MNLPEYIIIPLDWLNDYKDWGTDKKQALTPQAVLETFAIVPTMNSDQNTHEENMMNLASMMGDDLFEDASPDEYAIFEQMWEGIMDKYYTALNEYVPFELIDKVSPGDEYIFVNWINETTAKLGLRSIVKKE
jgi:hypothetical protein